MLITPTKIAVEVDRCAPIDENSGVLPVRPFRSEFSEMHRSPQQLTLREKLSEAEKLTRELMHHVEHGFVPKAHDLRRVTRQSSDPNAEEVSDLTVRNTAARTLESDQYTRKLCEQLNGMLRYIQDDIERLQGRA